MRYALTKTGNPTLMQFCIDTKVRRLLEKNEQVAIMNTIYGNAQLVRVWLGEADEWSCMAIRFIKEEISRLTNFDDLCDSPRATDKWLALLHLMQRPWFSRRWVVQEIALARNARIHCGSDEILWKDFATAVEMFVQVETSTHRISNAVRPLEKSLPSVQVRATLGAIEHAYAASASLLVNATQRLSQSRKMDEAEDHESHRREVPAVASYYERESPRPSSLGLIGRLHFQALSPLSLEYLVSTLTTFDTTVPHDGIYALLCIAEDTMPRRVYHGLSPRHILDGLNPLLTRRHFDVDYRLPYVLVCKKFVEGCIERSIFMDVTRAIDVICRPWACNQETLLRYKTELVKRGDTGMELDFSLPSWIVQSSRAAMGQQQSKEIKRQNPDSLVGLPRPARRNYAASGNKEVDLSFLKFRRRTALQMQPNHFSLYVRGFILDVVYDVGEVATDGKLPRSWAETMVHRTASGRLPDSFWQTLVANRLKEDEPPPTYWAYACEEIFRKDETSTIIDTTAVINSQQSSLVTQFCRRIQATTWNRTMIRTDHGRIGLASSDIRCGDVICILYGCSVPVILRRNDRKSQDAVDEELFHEIKYAQNSLTRCYWQHTMRKERLELRKRKTMVSLCRQWHGTTNLSHKHGLDKSNIESPSPKEMSTMLRNMITKAIESFSDWRSKERKKLWNDYNSTLIQVGETLHVDWWAFSLALKAGRHWLKVTIKHPNATKNVPFATTRKDINKLHEHETFKQWRKAHNKWLDIPRDVAEKNRHIIGDDKAEHEVRIARDVLYQRYPKSLEEDTSRYPKDGVAKPAWIRDVKKYHLSWEERNEYNQSIERNLRIRLGANAYDSYRLLGESYIHGMMDGEAVELASLQDTNPSRVFEIR
jgi:hypothetical protein